MADDQDLEERIRERAFQIWDREGRPHGRDREHWDMARRELMGADDAPPLQPPEPIGEVKYAQTGLIDGGEGQSPGERS
jgi:Protein of unknown function (DUF2934)